MGGMRRLLRDVMRIGPYLSWRLLLALRRSGRSSYRVSWWGYLSKKIKLSPVVAKTSEHYKLGAGWATVPVVRCSFHS